MNSLNEADAIDAVASTGELTHLDSQGLPRMVDVSAKAETLREAEAEAVLVAAAGPVDLMADIPIEIGDIEKLMQRCPGRAALPNVGRWQKMAR